MKPIVLCLLFLLRPSPGMASEQVLAGKLDQLLERQALPGVVWAAIGESGPMTGGNGVADIVSARPMTADTKVHVGSVTKVMLALGVLRLVSEGDVRLDSNVEQLTPALNWRNPWHAEAPVQVRHLLEHTAGLDNLRLWQLLNSTATPETPLRDAFPVDQRRLLQIRSRPGSQYSYSNMGYALLGVVIEQVTGKRYEDYLAESLLAPLGMQDSSFHLITQDDDGSLAMGHLDDNVPQPAVPTYLRPAGQFATTANDMLRLLDFSLGDGSLNGKRLIRQELMAQLGNPSSTTAFRHHLAIGHGLALAGRDRHGVLGYCHPGTTFGFRAYLCLFSDEGKAFFYAINADHETADYEGFNRLFIEHLDVQQRAVATTTADVEALDPYTGLYTPSPNNMEQFTWLDWMFNSIWVRKHDSTTSLVVQSLQQPSIELHPLGWGTFRESTRTQASHVFIEHTALTDGLTTWQRSSWVALMLGWLSLFAGALALAYTILRGSWLLIRRPHAAGSSLLLPYLLILAFALPAFLYSRQHFLAFGEINSASVSVAVLTSALPLLLVLALAGLKRQNRMFLPDLLALAAMLQFCLVLIYHGALPVMFWS